MPGDDLQNQGVPPRDPGGRQRRDLLVRLQAHQLDEALALIQEAIKLKQRVLPPDSPDLAQSLVSLAELNFARGDPAAAATNNIRAQEIFLRAYGPGSPQLAVSLSNLGEYLIAQGRFSEAIEKFQDALKHWDMMRVGPDHRFLAYPLMGMGRALESRTAAGCAGPAGARAADP